MTYIIQASIGRNIGNVPMSSRDWSRFLNDVSDAIRVQGESPEIHTGVGTWEGIREESAHLTFYRDEMPSNGDRTTMVLSLSRLATKYGQDAIGLTVSPVFTVRAEPLNI